MKMMYLLFGLSLVMVTGNTQANFYKGILWEVQRDGAAPSYVFGTFHSDDEAILDLPVRVRKALHRSRLLIVEMQTDRSSSEKMQRAMVLDQDENLREILNDNLIHAEAVSGMAKRGIPRQYTNLLKPWAIYMQLNAPEKVQGVFQDALLQILATMQNKPVAGLETPYEQAEVYDGLSDQEQIALLSSLLDEAESQADDEFERVKRYYLQRDLNKLADEVSTAHMSVDDALKDKIQRRLVDSRNQVMVDRMLPHIEQGNAFIAIGALHLPGEKGVLEQLKGSGYQVTAVY